jgi:MFS family permease
VVRSAVSKALSGRHWIIALACLESVRGGVLGVGLPLKLSRLGWSDLDLGLFAALGSVTYSIAAALYGFKVQRAPLRLLMAVSGTVCAALALGLATAEGKAELFVLGAAHALGVALFWPSLMAWIGESEDEHLVGDMGAFNGAWMVGLTVGFLAGGAAEEARPGVAIYLGAAMSLGVALLVPFAHIRGRLATSGAPVSPPTAVILPRRFFVAGWLAAFLTTLSVGMPEAIFVKLNKDLGFGGGDFGVFLALGGAARTAVALALAAFQGWRYRRWPLVSCLLASAAGGALLSAAWPGARAAVAIAFILLGVGIGMGYSLGFYYSVHGRRNRKRNAGFFEAMVASQAVVGGPVGGLLAMGISRRAPYAAIAAAACLAAAVQWCLLRRVGERLRALGGSSDRL